MIFELVVTVWGLVILTNITLISILLNLLISSHWNSEVLEEVGYSREEINLLVEVNEELLLRRNKQLRNVRIYCVFHWLQVCDIQEGTYLYILSVY